MMTTTHDILCALKEKRIDPRQAREALAALRTPASGVWRAILGV